MIFCLAVCDSPLLHNCGLYFAQLIHKVEFCGEIAMYVTHKKSSACSPCSPHTWRGEVRNTASVFLPLTNLWPSCSGCSKSPIFRECQGRVHLRGSCGNSVQISVLLLISGEVVSSVAF